MEKIKKMACVTVAGTIFISGLGISINAVLKKKSNYDNKVVTSYSTEYSDFTEKYIEIESNDNPIIDEIVTNIAGDNIEEEPVSYSELKYELNSIINEKKLDEVSKELIMKTFDYVYNNYPSFEEIYKLNNCLTKEEFIQKNIINNLRNNISTFELVDLTSYDGDAFGGYYTPSTRTLEIGYYGNLNDLSLITKTMHEFCHAGQLALFYNNEIDPNILLIFTEGQSTLKETSIDNSYSLTSGMNFSNGKNNECYSIKGVSNNNPEYIIYSKCYGALYSIVDHEVLEKVNETGNINLVVEYITNNYGVDGNLLLEQMAILCNSYIHDNEEEVCKNIELLEQSINKCFVAKLNNCNSREEIISFMNLRRNYNMQFASVCLTNYEDKYSFDIAKESDLDPYNINDMLYNKCLEYEVIPMFSDDKQTNRNVFGSIMGESTDYFSYYAVGEKKSILNLKYSLSEDEMVLTIYDNNKPILQFNYKSNEVIREQEFINNLYVISEPNFIISQEHVKVIR